MGNYLNLSVAGPQKGREVVSCYDSAFPVMNREKTVANCCSQAALSGGWSTLAGDSVLAVVPLGCFEESNTEGESMGADLQKPLNHGLVSLCQ